MERPIGSLSRMLRSITLAITLAGAIAAGVLLIFSQGRTRMVPRETPSQKTPTPPPIDVDLPANTETATFAMG